MVDLKGTYGMPAEGPRLTAWPEVDAAVNAFRAGVDKILGEHLIGIYLHGSLASGDFNPERSDIDFLVVTAKELPDEILSALGEMHSCLTSSGLPWVDKLEGAYIPKQALRRYDPAHARHPWLGADGHFAVEPLNSDWVIQRSILREKGVVVTGPPLQTLIDPVLPGERRQAVRRILQEWWLPQLQDPHRLHSAEYQAYAILTMARALYTLQYGKVVSKPVAARWAQGTMGEPRASLMKEAAEWRRDMKLDRLSETMDLIRYTIEHSRQMGGISGKPRAPDAP